MNITYRMMKLIVFLLLITTGFPCCANKSVHDKINSDHREKQAQQDTTWKAPDELPTVSFEGYQPGGILISLPGKTIDEIKQCIITAISDEGFSHALDGMINDDWRLYTGFKEMTSKIEGLPHRVVVASLLFTVHSNTEGCTVKIQHRTAYAIIRVDEDWRKKEDPELNKQLLKYLDSFRSILCKK